MANLRIRDAASILGVSDDTVRRLVESGALPHGRDPSGRMVIAGAALADYVRQQAQPPGRAASSARNRLRGLVTQVRVDGVMAQVELQCGPFRVVSLLSAEAVADLGLEPGSVAVAVIKATNVIVEAGGGSQ